MRMSACALWVWIMICLASTAFGYSEQDPDPDPASPMYRKKFYKRIKAEGLTYTCYLVPHVFTDMYGQVYHMFYDSEIQVHNKHKKLIYKENTTYDPRSEKARELPALSKLPYKDPQTRKKRWIVLFHGHDNNENGHSVLTVYRRKGGENAIESTELILGQIFSSITKIKESYVSEVYRREYFPVELGERDDRGVVHIFYKLNLKTFCFVPYFDKNINRKFLKDYKHSKYMMVPDCLDEMDTEERRKWFSGRKFDTISSLAAVENPKFICNELKDLKTITGYDEDEFQFWFDIVSIYGYPGFNISKCKEKGNEH